MKNLTIIDYCLNGKQFTQLGFDVASQVYFVSVFFRHTNKFRTKCFDSLPDAEIVYDSLK